MRSFLNTFVVALVAAFLLILFVFVGLPGGKFGEAELAFTLFYTVGIGLPFAFIVALVGIVWRSFAK